MNDPLPTPASAPPAPCPPPPPAPAGHPAWLLVVVLLVGGQGWLALRQFGGERPWEGLLDASPVVSGRHPLHLYHGFLGARTLRERGTLSCYDPAFHAGYPKTPVFDGGSRPAELSLALAGGGFNPAAYKVALAVICSAAPLLLFLGGRGAGLPRGSACLGCLLGMVVWWGGPAQDAYLAGDADLLLAGLLALAQAGMLVGYDRSPGVWTLLGVVATGLLGWFAHPPLSVLLAPAFLVFYLSVGCRHTFVWHAPLLSGLALAAGANGFWLVDWLHYWWIRVPLTLDAPLVAHRTLRALWEAPLWGGAADRTFAVALLGFAAAGSVLFNQTGRRASARLFGCSALAFVTLAVAGSAWEPFGRLGSAQLLVPGLLFAAVPAACAVTRGWAYLANRGNALAPYAAAGALGCATYLVSPALTSGWAAALVQPRPLDLGLSPDGRAVVEALSRHTNEDARILWEDRRTGRLGSRWSSLLPLLTGRSYIGGLDPEAGIEHAVTGLVDQLLAGKPLREWADADLERYCRRYNVGWVVCWTPGARDRFQAWPGARALQTLPAPDGQGTLFRIDRSPSFALTGSVTVRAADTRHILLAEAVPARGSADGPGHIDLSLHYQAGMRVTPARVKLERALSAEDAIPFVRLRLSEPVGRIMITWEGR